MDLLCSAARAFLFPVGSCAGSSGSSSAGLLSRTAGASSEVSAVVAGLLDLRAAVGGGVCSVRGSTERPVSVGEGE